MYIAVLGGWGVRRHWQWLLLGWDCVVCSRSAVGARTHARARSAKHNALSTTTHFSRHAQSQWRHAHAHAQHAAGAVARCWQWRWCHRRRWRPPETLGETSRRRDDAHAAALHAALGNALPAALEIEVCPDCPTMSQWAWWAVAAHHSRRCVTRCVWVHVPMYHWQCTTGSSVSVVVQLGRFWFNWPRQAPTKRHPQPPAKPTRLLVCLVRACMTLHTHTHTRTQRLHT